MLMRYRVLIVDAHPLMRQGLRAMVESSPEFCVVADASRGHEAIQKVAALRPDLVLVDMSLPDMSGLEVIAQVCRRFPAQKFIALSESHDDACAAEAIRAGCLGHLLKATSTEEVALAMKSVALGHRFMSGALVHELTYDLLPMAQAEPGKPTQKVLTVRERSVFRLIAEGKTNRIAADCLSLSPKTIEKHRKSLMRKLEVRSTVELTLLAIHLGVIERPAMSNALHQRA
jgi:DNA-binding NarL/FixJ family response regulator